MKQKVGRPAVKDKKVPVTFMALESKVKSAKKKAGLNAYLEQALYDFNSR